MLTESLNCEKYAAQEVLAFHNLTKEEKMEPNDINFAAMPQTAVNVVTKPADFFQSMPKTGGFLEPLVFAVIMGFISGIIQAILHFIGLGPGAGYGGGMHGFFSIIFIPVYAAVGSFIGGAILFVIWKLMGSQEDYETAYRCGAYLMALAPLTALIGAIPYAGGIINMFIYVFYLVKASIHVHNIPSQRAWLVFGVIFALFALIGVYGEHKARTMKSQVEQWRKIGENMRKEYLDKSKDMRTSTEEMRKQTEEMAKQFKAQADEARRQVEKK